MTASSCSVDCVTSTYTYDVANELTNVTAKRVNLVVGNTDYYYDADGNRLRSIRAVRTRRMATTRPTVWFPLTAHQQVRHMLTTVTDCSCRSTRLGPALN